MNDDETTIIVLEADLRRFAPKAKREYITAILGNLSQMRQAGILDSELRWCHFVAQVGHETDGLRIIRESLNYTSVKRIREVWPARFRSWSDADMATLVRNPDALGDAVYGGRMGNRLKSDGCAFRGGGPLQTTGRAAIVRYASSLGLDPSPTLLDDCNVTMQFACLEWLQSGCNDHADSNDIVAVSKTINVGSATSGVTPVGMDSRKEWFAKAWTIWGDKGRADRPKNVVTNKEVARKWLPIGVGGAVGLNEVVSTVKEVLPAGVPAVPEAATKSLENFSAWKTFGKSFFEVGKEISGVALVAGKLWPIMVVAGVAGGGLALVAWRKRGAS